MTENKSYLRAVTDGQVTPESREVVERSETFMDRSTARVSEQLQHNDSDLSEDQGGTVRNYRSLVGIEKTISLWQWYIEILQNVRGAKGTKALSHYDLISKIFISGNNGVPFSKNGGLEECYKKKDKPHNIGETGLFNSGMKMTAMRTNRLKHFSYDPDTNNIEYKEVDYKKEYDDDEWARNYAETFFRYDSLSPREQQIFKEFDECRKKLVKGTDINYLDINVVACYQHGSTSNYTPVELPQSNDEEHTFENKILHYIPENVEMFHNGKKLSRPMPEYRYRAENFPGEIVDVYYSIDNSDKDEKVTKFYYGHNCLSHNFLSRQSIGDGKKQWKHKGVSKMSRDIIEIDSGKLIEKCTSDLDFDNYIKAKNIIKLPIQFRMTTGFNPDGSDDRETDNKQIKELGTNVKFNLFGSFIYSPRIMEVGNVDHKKHIMSIINCEQSKHEISKSEEVLVSNFLKANICNAQKGTPMPADSKINDVIALYRQSVFMMWKDPLTHKTLNHMCKIAEKRAKLARKPEVIDLDDSEEGIILNVEEHEITVNIQADSCSEGSEDTNLPGASTSVPYPSSDSASIDSEVSSPDSSPSPSSSDSDQVSSDSPPASRKTKKKLKKRNKKPLENGDERNPIFKKYLDTNPQSKMIEGDPKQVKYKIYLAHCGFSDDTESYLEIKANDNSYCIYKIGEIHDETIPRRFSGGGLTKSHNYGNLMGLVEMSSKIGLSKLIDRETETINHLKKFAEQIIGKEYLLVEKKTSKIFEKEFHDYTNQFAYTDS